MLFFHSTGWFFCQIVVFFLMPQDFNTIRFYFPIIVLLAVLLNRLYYFKFIIIVFS